MTNSASPASSWLTMTDPASACLCQTRPARSESDCCDSSRKIDTCRSRSVLSKDAPGGFPSLAHRDHRDKRCLTPPGLGPKTRDMQPKATAEPMELPDALTLSALLQHLGVRGDRGAVERNGEVVKKARHCAQKRASRDALEN